MTIQELQQLLEESKKAIPNNPVLSSRQPALPPDRSTISARHPYEVTLPYNQIGPFPSNMSAGAPRGEVAYDPRSYAKEAVMNLPTALQIGPVFHGSPYKFTKFKNEAIGTGEGAQSFGYGHYLTEVEDVAKHYAPQASMFGSKVEETVKKLREEFPENIYGVVKKLKKENPNATIQDADRWMVEHQTDYDKLRIAEHLSTYTNWDTARHMLRNERQQKLFDEMMKSGDINITGNIYEAALHKGKKPGEYKYLPWDIVPEEIFKDISLAIEKEFPNTELLSAIKACGKYGEGHRLGANVYNTLSDYLGGQKQASAFLQRSGISGIKYPAGSLSGVKSDKFNYVVFDPEDIAIEGVK